jgi:dipeptidase D
MEELKLLEPPVIWKCFYELTQILRPTGQMEDVTRYVLAFGKELGLETRQDEQGNVLILKPAAPGFEQRPTVVMQSHLDIVMTGEERIVPVVDGEWVRSKGATTLGADNGIGVAMMMAVLADRTLRHGPLEALFTVDEEVGMDGAGGLKPGFLKGRILLNFDSEEEGELYVGCAGGEDVNVTFQYKKGVPLFEGDVAVKITLDGLMGGHSGLDIDKGRANANKLMFRFLKEAIRDYGARLATVEGGTKRNVIPSEAVAVITLPDDNVEALWELVADCQERWRTEYAGIETRPIRFAAELTGAPAGLIPEEIQDDLVNAIEGCRNGVCSMLNDFPGTVESSSNLAVVRSSKGKIEVGLLVRSASETRKEAICSSLESVFSLAGARVEYGSAYSGWQPDMQSPVLQTAVATHEALHGCRPLVKVVHAGLECGIIQGVYPGMDMVSFGPDIRGAHSSDEAVRIASVRNTFHFLIALLEAVAR